MLLSPTVRKLRRAGRRWTDRWRRQGDVGSMSLFWIVVSLGLLAFIGAVADLGLLMHADSRADALAQEAARTGGQQLDPAQAITGTALVVDPDAARQAAENYLTAAGVHGTVRVTDGGTRLEVDVTDTYKTLFLGIVGTSTLPVTGHGSAHLVTQAGG